MSIAADSLDPIVAEIAAPADTVFGLLSLKLPNPSVKPMPDQVPDGQMATVTCEGASRWRSVELVIAAPPDMVIYRLIRGPCAHLERHFYIRERDRNTRVLVQGSWAPGGVFGRFSSQKQVAQATRSLLANVQQQAEHLARMRIVPSVEVTRPDSGRLAPTFLQHQLLNAIEEQEAYEWGCTGHGAGTAQYATLLANALHLPEDFGYAMELAGTLHDVGKTRMEPQLFDRAGALSAGGQRRIEQHPQLGAAMVMDLPMSELLIPAIRHHHERWDGTGYPDGLKGSAIPLPARIIAVAEAADTMLRPLPDRAARSSAEVASILRRHAGRQWDANLACGLADILTHDAPPLPPGV